MAYTDSSLVLAQKLLDAVDANRQIGVKVSVEEILTVLRDTSCNGQVTFDVDSMMQSLTSLCLAKNASSLTSKATNGPVKKQSRKAQALKSCSRFYIGDTSDSDASSSSDDSMDDIWSSDWRKIRCCSSDASTCCDEIEIDTSTCCDKIEIDPFNEQFKAKGPGKGKGQGRPVVREKSPMVMLGPAGSKLNTPLVDTIGFQMTVDPPSMLRPADSTSLKLNSTIADTIGLGKLNTTLAETTGFQMTVDPPSMLRPAGTKLLQPTHSAMIDSLELSKICRVQKLMSPNRGRNRPDATAHRKHRPKHGLQKRNGKYVTT